MIENVKSYNSCFGGSQYLIQTLVAVKLNLANSKKNTIWASLFVSRKA